MSETPTHPTTTVLDEILAGLELPFAELCRPRRLHPATPIRWRLKGVRAADGHVVKLEAVRIGRRWVTSAPAFERFVATTSQPSSTAVSPPRPVSTGRADGIGFLLTPDDPLAGIDPDGCRDPDTGDLADRAAGLVSQLDTYTEVSPSGSGVRLFAVGKPAAYGPTRRGRSSGSGRAI